MFLSPFRIIAVFSIGIGTCKTFVRDVMHSAYLYTLNWFRKTVFEKKEFEIVFRSDILLYYYLYIFDSLPITREDKEMLDSLIFTITKFRFQRNDANTKRPYLKHKKIKSRLLSSHSSSPFSVSNCRITPLKTVP